jgi:hypothetical protein
LIVTAFLAFLLAANLIFYTPRRLGMLEGLYGVQASHLKPFQIPSAQALAPALIIVHTSNGWIEYGTLLELETPFLDTPFIFAYSRGPDVDGDLAGYFPDRKVYQYFPAQDPYVFYTSPASSD